MVKITLEFEGVEQAIVALGKLGGIAAAAAPAKERKGRADKGQTRGEYKPRAQDGKSDASTAPDAGAAPAPAVAPVVATPQAGVTESGSATSAGPSTVPEKSAATPAPSPSSPSDAVKAEILAQQKAHGTGFEPTIGEKDAEVQAAIEKVYGKFGIDKVRVLLADFGIDRARNLPKSKKADFLAAAKKLVA